MQIDGYTTTGSLKGMDTLKPGTYVEATGQFIVENEIQEFKIQSWKVSKKLEDDGLLGTLHRDGAKVILSTADQGDYTLVPDVPADLPLPFENAFVIGTTIGNTFDWKSIDYRTTASGGGGGGGGFGFYQLNLSGNPIPFPTAIPSPTLSAGPVVTSEPNTPAPETNTPPTLTIEKVELVYFVSNPLYQANDPSAGRRSPYIQPAWHFSGHYSNGDSYDILIQALEQEFLSPELAPYIQGG
jgi:hypothetical protein